MCLHIDVNASTSIFVAILLMLTLLLFFAFCVKLYRVLVHLSQSEVCKIDQMQKRGSTAAASLRALQQAKRRSGKTGPSQAAVYRATARMSYKRGATEQRGRPSRAFNTTFPTHASRLQSGHSQVTVRSQSGLQSGLVNTNRIDDFIEKQ